MKKMKKALLLSFLWLMPVCSHADKVLYFDDFESNHHLPVQPRSFNQPYTIQEWGFKKENGNTFYRVVTTGKHAMELCAAPRTKDRPKISWGTFAPGLAGHFHHTPLNIPIDMKKGYLLSLKLRSDSSCTNS